MRHKFFPVLAAMAIIFTGCSRDAATIRVALLPVLDSLPGYIAAEAGFFADQNVNVEIVSVNNSLDRDQMMQSGEIDLMLAELSASALFNAETVRIQTVATVRESAENLPLFRIISGRESGILTVEDLKGQGIAVGENGITEYTAYRILRQAGLTVQEIRFQSLPVIPERFSLLMSGGIDAAILPDPLASAAIAAGNHEIINDTVIPKLSASVLAASKKSLQEKEDLVKSFLRAWYMGAEELNRNPEEALSFYMKTLPAPEGLEEYFTIPPFPEARVPAENAWDDMIEWFKMKGIIDTDVEYSSSVSSEYLPGH